jgi:hypothetical protein
MGHISFWSVLMMLTYWMKTNIINKKSTEALLDVSKEDDLEVNAEKMKYLFFCHHQTTGQDHYIKVANQSFENVAKFKY